MFRHNVKATVKIIVKATVNIILNNSEYNTQSNNFFKDIFEDNLLFLGVHRNIDKTNTLINTINKQDGGGFMNNNDKF